MSEIDAATLWESVVSSATKTAEPGLLMWDNITRNLPAHAYPEFETKTTNPCGEIPLSAYDSCRLLSLNLKSLVKNSFEKNADFDFEKLKEVAAIGMRLSDDLVELEVEKLEKIERCTEGEALELTTELIDELIQFDLKMHKFFNNVNLEQELLQYLMDEGLESGLIGKA